MHSNLQSIIEKIFEAADKKTIKQLERVAEALEMTSAETAATILETALADVQLKTIKTLATLEEKQATFDCQLWKLSPGKMSKLHKYSQFRGLGIPQARQELFNQAYKLIPKQVRPYEMLRDFPVKTAEVVDTTTARIELENGRVFYSYISNARHHKLYHLFRNELPQTLTPETYQLAVEIEKRYFHGATYELIPGQGGVIVEGGAYVGLKAIAFADKVGPTGKVIAIEIDRHNFELMQRNIWENGLEDIIVPVHAGIWNESGRAENRHSTGRRHFLTRTDKWESEMKQIDIVPTDTLDNILDAAGVETVDFLNLQVNGAEVEALEGLQRRFNDVKVYRIASYYSSDGVRKADVVLDILKERGCFIHTVTELGSITAMTQQFG